MRGFCVFSWNGWLIALLGGSLICQTASADLVRGGGSRRNDCVVVFDVPGANKPPPPKEARHVDCTDGDPSCDADGERNGVCVFDLTLCVNSSVVESCLPEEATSIEIAHAIDNGDRKFDPDFQALQQRADLIGLPNDTPDLCGLQSAITVPLKGPNKQNKMSTRQKRVKVSSFGIADGRNVSDRDVVRFKCRPEGDKIYLPRDLYDGTFDRISQQIFAQSCALSGCHDSETVAGGMELLPSGAYNEIVGVAPQNIAADLAGLLRVTPGDPDLSLIYRKLTGDLEAGWGERMPLDSKALSGDLIELIRLWIEGDQTLGPAPEDGWVEGTD